MNRMPFECEQLVLTGAELALLPLLSDNEVAEVVRYLYMVRVLGKEPEHIPSGKVAYFLKLTKRYNENE